MTMLFWHGFRNGDWLTASRLRGYSVLMLALWVAGLVGWIALSDGLNDRNGKPLGTDFSSFYTAGELARAGRANDAYDMAEHHVQQKRLFGAATPYYAFAYPPVFLLIAAPLSVVPYRAALAIWQFGSFVLYLAALGLIAQGARRKGLTIGPVWMLIAASFPAVAINLGHGQNGFLTAAIFAAALAWLKTHPARAGALFALLAYKPQFALLIPFAMVAGGQWRAIAAGIVTLSALIAITTLAFGIDVWPAFLASSETARRLLLEEGAVGYEKLQSAFAAVRLWGGSVPIAYVVQGIASLAAIASVIWAWHGRDDDATKAAILIFATLVASPHLLDYDFVLLAPALAFMAVAGLTRGFAPYEISLLAAAWTMPLVARAIAGATLIPLGLVVTLALLASALQQHKRLAQA